MIQANKTDYLSPTEAAGRLHVTPRRIYQLVAHDLLRAERMGGRLLIRRDEVEERVGLHIVSGRPFSPKRAWGLVLLAAGQEPLELDPATRSKLRRLLRERSMWSLRSRLGNRAARHAVRAHSSDLLKILAEPGVIPTGARYAAEAGLNLVAPNAVLELYVTGTVARKLETKYRLEESNDANLVLRVLPISVEGWVIGNLAPRPAIALDVAERSDSRSKAAARLALGG
jgi:excisionase family DNA binding protein